MRTIRYFLLLAVFFCAVSCATALTSKAQKLRVGMSRQEVVNTLGKNFEVIHSVLTPQGEAIEILKYTDMLLGDMYECEFYNGTLVRFTKVYDAPEKPERPHRH